MAGKAIIRFLLFFFRFLLKRLRNPYPHRRKANPYTPTSEFHKFSANSLRPKCSLPDKLSNQTLVCDIEGVLLKSTSLFPYFMLVAFEGGGLLRAFVLLLLYPLLSCFSREMALKVMVMVSFLGIRKEGFMVGRAVLPKYLLEDVGLEGYEVLKRGGRRVGVSEMPRVMVEGFLKEYMGVEVVLGRELKVVCGYYVGLMEEKEKIVFEHNEEKAGDGAVGIGRLKRCLDHPLLSLCKVMIRKTISNSLSY